MSHDSDEDDAQSIESAIGKTQSYVLQRSQLRQHLCRAFDQHVVRCQEASIRVMVAADGKTKGLTTPPPR